jgi:hypothetical protein
MRSETEILKEVYDLGFEEGANNAIYHSIYNEPKEDVIVFMGEVPDYARMFSLRYKISYETGYEEGYNQVFKRHQNVFTQIKN